MQDLVKTVSDLFGVHCRDLKDVDIMGALAMRLERPHCSKDAILPEISNILPMQGDRILTASLLAGNSSTAARRTQVIPVFANARRVFSFFTSSRSPFLCPALPYFLFRWRQESGKIC